MTESNEVTAADIARFARVGRAAVSNWRRRHPDFPQPIGGPTTSPTFSREAVEAWLRATGKTTGDNPPRAVRRTSDTDLATAMVALLPPKTTGLVLDPACGSGSVLVAAAERFHGDATYAGQVDDRADIDAVRHRVEASRDVRATIVAGTALGDDALAGYLGTADVVVCAPPTGTSWQPGEASPDHPWEFGPPHHMDAPLAWLQICFGYLRPGGHAIVSMPLWAAIRASGRRIRAELLRAGVLTHVIALPDQFAPHGPWHIWVLERPTGRPTYTVKMVDLTGLAASDVPLGAPGWRGVFTDEKLTRDIPSIELLDDEVLLIPARHVEPPIRDVTSEYADLQAAFGTALDNVQRELPAFDTSHELVNPPMTSISDLARAGALEFADRNGELREGDVLIPTGANRFDAVVVTEADLSRERVPGEVIRCDPNQLDPLFVACFLRSETNRRHAAGTQGGTFRLDVRRARIPRIPLTDQRRFGAAFGRLVEFAATIDRTAALATDAVDTAVYGITSGQFSTDVATRPTSAGPSRHESGSHT